MWRQDKGALAIAGCVIATFFLLMSTTFPASADTVADERRFVELVNELRSDKGLQPLLIDNELRVEARAWSQTMAAKDSLEHSTNLASGISADWTLLGENVGVTNDSDVDDLFQAFIDSPAHYRNLVDPDFTLIGIGVVYGPKGKLWTTHRFMSVQAATPPPATTPATPPPATTPPSTTPPSTAPPAPAPAEPSSLDADLIADVLSGLEPGS